MIIVNNMCKSQQISILSIFTTNTTGYNCYTTAMISYLSVLYIYIYSSCISCIVFLICGVRLVTDRPFIFMYKNIQLIQPLCVFDVCEALEASYRGCILVV